MAERTLLAQIVTPEKVAYTNEVEMVVATTPEGEIGILPLHAPLVTTLGAGDVRLKFGEGAGDWEIFSASGGYLQVYEDKVIVLADQAAAVSKIDVDRCRQEAELMRKQLEEMPEEADERDELLRDLSWYETQLRTAERARG